MNVKHVLFLLIVFFEFNVGAAWLPFKIENVREYELLEKLFRTFCTQEEYGYVLEGVKPISVRNFYHPAHIPLCANTSYTEQEFLKSLLIFEALPLIKKMNSYEKTIVLKAAHLSMLGSDDLGIEIQFINVPVLKQAIEENISLFKYILGPTVTAKNLVDRIAFSEESLSDILQENHVLIGIVLGFGTHNSLIGGRQEQISFLTFSRDMAPFALKSQILNDLKECYGWLYLNAAGGDDQLMSFRTDYAPLAPMLGFLTIQEEIAAINQLNESLPSCLMDEEPFFRFGAYKGELSNEKRFSDLKRSQKNIQDLLKQETFLESVLTQVLGGKPIINCEKTHSSSLDFSFFKGTIGAKGWEELLLQVANDFEDEEKINLFLSFFNPSNEPMLPARFNASKSTLNGLKKARENLSLTRQYFENLSKDSSLSTLVDSKLYFKILQSGSGQDLIEFDRIRMSYSIADLNGHILSANHDTWLSTIQLIPGLAHGLKGMKIGEKRQIYIHPSLAYGVLTTLPPCMGLIATVQLLDIDKKYSNPLPPLAILDCNWIEDPLLLREIEESVRNKPFFVGWFYRHLLDKIEGNEAQNIVSSIQKEKFQKMQGSYYPISVSETEETSHNRKT